MPVLQPAQDSVAALLRTVADGTGRRAGALRRRQGPHGWAIATLLTVAGADRDAVLADYLQSNAAIESLRAWMQAQYGDAFLADNGSSASTPATCRPPGIRPTSISARSTATWKRSGSTTMCSRRIRRRLVG